MNIDAEVVFTKARMNNKLNVLFSFQNTGCLQKCTKTKAVFTKTGMNNKRKFYFFSKYRLSSKMYQDRSCIYQDKNKQQIKHWFF